MKFYNYDTFGKFIGESEGVLNPLETQKQKKNVYLVPAKSTDIKPPEAKEGFDLFFVNDKWEYREIPKLEEPKPYEPTEQEKTQMQIDEAETYLSTTDYKVIKAFETGEIIDAAVTQKRQECRNKINELRDKLNGGGTK
jgi:hypothetical protein